MAMEKSVKKPLHYHLFSLMSFCASKLNYIGIDMLGTQHFNLFIRSLADQLLPQPTQYSGYLRATKPLIDISKQANINERVYHYTKRLIADSQAPLVHLPDDLPPIAVHKTKASQQKALTAHFRREWQYRLSLEQSRLIESLAEGAKLAPMITSALADLSYAIKQLDDGALVAERDNASAILSIPCSSDINKFNDTFWSEQALRQLNALKDKHHCAAAVYITPGRIDMQHRALSKKLDIFVLSGWEVIRLLHDTRLCNSPTFDTLDRVGGRV